VGKLGLIITGLVIGIFAEIGALVSVYHGTNLFHGGHPNAVVCVLLPGLGIIDHLADDVHRAIPAVFIIISLLQFPVYGVLGGYHYATKSLTKIILGIGLLHISGSLLAGYGIMLDKKWQNDAEVYGNCRRTHAAAEEISINSDRISRLVTWIDQTRKELVRLRASKAGGAVFTPDPEPAMLKNIDDEQKELQQRWQFYQDNGGPAKSPETVVSIPSPCGQAPHKPTLF